MIVREWLISAAIALSICPSELSSARAEDNPPSAQFPVSAPINTDTAGNSGIVAIQSVFRIVCPAENTSGTGFLHKSGGVLTAAHVVKDCTDIIVMTASGARIKATVSALEAEVDLALLAPQQPLKVAALPLKAKFDLAIGTQVVTWGFPGGYQGAAPLLSVGYLSGLESIASPGGQPINRWVVNAAFNLGNSGGPLIHIETGEVIGVVSSKLAPISPRTQNILDVLESQQSGLQYTESLPDGSKKSVSEGSLVGYVLHELRAQVQLVIGYATMSNDLGDFLKRHGVDP